MYKLLRVSVVFVFILLITKQFAFAQLSSVGSPIVKNYTPEDYLAAPENYAIVQDKLGVMYFGNYGYVLEYDGVEWRKIEVKQYMPVLSMDIDSLGRIYVSSGNEFGFLASDSLGLLKYHSLSILLEKAENQVDGIGKTHVAKDGVYFQTATNIYKYPYITEENRTNLEVLKKTENWTTETRYLNSFLVQVEKDERFLILEESKGIVSLEEGNFRLLKKSYKLMTQQSIVSILSPMYRRLMFVASAKKGITAFSDKSGGKTNFRIDTKEKNYWEKLTILSAYDLPEYYVFATLNKGTMVVNKHRDMKKKEKRKLVEQYNKQSGMLSEQVSQIYNNQEHNKGMLWFTSKYGISKTKINSALRRLSEADNTKDIILDLKRFDKLLYARTLGKIYYLKDTLDEYNLRSVKNVSASSDWIIFTVEDVEIVESTKKISKLIKSKKKRFRKQKTKKRTRLIKIKKPVTKPVEKIFAASEYGLFEVTNNEGKIVNFSQQVDTSYKLVATENTASKYKINKLYRSKHTPNRIFIGLKDGLAVISYQHGMWIDEGRIPNVNENISSIAEDTLGNIWLGIKNNGLLYLELPDTTMHTKLKAIYKEDGDSIEFNLFPTSKFEVKKYAKDNALPAMIENGIFDYNGTLLYSTIEGLYYFDEKTKKFKIYKKFHFGYDQTRVLSLDQDNDGNVWILIQTAFSSEILLYRKQENGELKQDKTALALLPAMTLRAIFPDNGGLVWISGTEGVFSYDLNKKNDEIDEFNTLIRKVSTNGDSVLFWGNAYSGTSNYKNQFNKILLEFQGNNIKFNFAAPFFDEEGEIEFSYYLEGDGLEKRWSKWSTITVREYMNLSKGNYVFHVKARNIYGTISKEAVFEFKVKTPWHEQWWAYAAELGLFLLLLLLSVIFNRMKNVRNSKLTAILTMIAVTAIFKLLAGLVFGPIVVHYAGDVIAVKIFMNIIIGALLFPTWALFTRLLQTGSMKDTSNMTAANSSTQDPNVAINDGGGDGDLS